MTHYISTKTNVLCNRDSSNSLMVIALREGEEEKPKNKVANSNSRKKPNILTQMPKEE